jgi:Metallo-peptidase family M12
MQSILAGCVLLAAGGRAALAEPREISIESRDFPQVAAGAPVGAGVRLENVQVADTGEAAAFVLQRFQVFADDATITVHGQGGATKVLPAPANTYFRGTVDGEPGSRVFLSVLPDGRTEGIVTRGEETYMIGGDEAAIKALDAPLEMRRVEPVMMKAARGEGFACGNTALPQNQHPLEDLVLNAEPAAAPEPAAAGTVLHTARVAIETDYEYYAKFNNATTATNYAGNLIGYASTIYVNEISTSLLVQSVSLWTSPSDPWTQTGSTLCGLMEFGRYWNLNKTGVSRTIAHFLSGKNLGGGIAWLGVLCSSGFGASASCPGLPTDASWGGGYGFTASITGTFNINAPTVMWDIMAVAHEIGHNFNSPHSHCYNGIGGSASPIDQCYSGEGGCYSGAASLPGPAGAGSGTIMSYCHLVRGSYSDVSLDFGTGHLYGVQPGREAARMSGYVTTTASANPTCLAPVAPAPPTPTDFYTLAPCRVLDTRNPNGPLGGPALGPNATRTFTVAGVCGVPATAKAVSANVTVIAGGTSGSIGIYPGNSSPMGIITVGFPAGATRASNSMLELATNGAGTIGVLNSSLGTSQVIIDVNGYFQ